jgi:hypothetical protein
MLKFNNIAVCFSWTGFSGICSQTVAMIDLALPHALFSAYLPAFLARTDYYRSTDFPSSKLFVFTEIHKRIIDLLKANYSVVCLAQQDVSVHCGAFPLLPATQTYKILQSYLGADPDQKLFLMKMLVTL